jgi:hypothetical protein
MTQEKSSAIRYDEQLKETALKSKRGPGKPLRNSTRKGKKELETPFSSGNRIGFLG